MKTRHATRSWAERICSWELEISGTIAGTVIGAYCLGSPSARRLLLISNEYGPGLYGKAIQDYSFVCFWAILFTFLRAALMQFVLLPWARFQGIKEPEVRQRFAEQGFSCTYYLVFWSAGMWIMYHSPHWFDTSHYWIGYPHLIIPAGMKWYYLLQLAFWFQQVYVLHVEKRRKDYNWMVAHHAITIILIVSSYYTNFTRIGNAVLCCMDFADILLSGAKILKYLGFTTACDVAFGLFALAWPITRHGLFTVIVWRTAVEPPKYLDMLWDPAKGKFFTPFTQILYLGLFLVLNVIMFYWFIMILGVIVSVLQGKSAEDTRSDDEDSPDDDKDDKKKLAKDE